MKKIPTAQEIMAKHSSNYKKTIELNEKPLFNLSINGHECINAMIEFAKLKVQEALEAVVKNITCEKETCMGQETGVTYVNEDSILNAYPLENIK